MVSSSLTMSNPSSQETCSGLNWIFLGLLLWWYWLVWRGLQNLTKDLPLLVLAVWRELAEDLLLAGMAWAAETPGCFISLILAGTGWFSVGVILAWAIG